MTIFTAGTYLGKPRWQCQIWSALYTTVSIISCCLFFKSMWKIWGYTHYISLLCFLFWMLLTTKIKQITILPLMKRIHSVFPVMRLVAIFHTRRRSMSMKLFHSYHSPSVSVLMYQVLLKFQTYWFSSVEF